MKTEKRFAVKVVRLTAPDTFTTEIIFTTDYKEIADHLAEKENGTVVDNYMSNEDLVMKEDSNYLGAIYTELNWYIEDLGRASQNPNTPHHHIEYLSLKINRKLDQMAQSMASIRKASQRKAGK